MFNNIYLLLENKCMNEVDNYLNHFKKDRRMCYLFNISRIYCIARCTIYSTQLSS